MSHVIGPITFRGFLIKINTPVNEVQDLVQIDKKKTRFVYRYINCIYMDIFTGVKKNSMEIKKWKCLYIKFVYLEVLRTSRTIFNLIILGTSMAIATQYPRRLSVLGCVLKLKN